MIQIDKAELLVALRHIRDNGPQRLDRGICIAVWQLSLQRDWKISDITRALKKYWVKWPEYSGDVTYPIVTNKKIIAYRQYDNCENKWNKRSPYGRARWRLLNWLIEQMEAENKI